MDNQVKKLNKWVLIAGVAGGALMTAMLGTAGAAPTTETTESSSASGHEQSRLTHMTATITAIDRSDRTRDAEEPRTAPKTTINVPSDVKVFDKLKTGEKVDIDYYQSLAVSLAPSGSKPSMSERRGRAVDMGGGVRGREVMVTAEVVSVDPSANTVTFKGPKGNLRTVHVEQPDAAGEAAVVEAGPGGPVRLHAGDRRRRSGRASKRERRGEGCSGWSCTPRATGVAVLVSAVSGGAGILARRRRRRGGGGAIRVDRRPSRHRGLLHRVARRAEPPARRAGRDLQARAAHAERRLAESRRHLRGAAVPERNGLPAVDPFPDRGRARAEPAIPALFVPGGAAARRDRCSASGSKTPRSRGTRASA